MRLVVRQAAGKIAELNKRGAYEQLRGSEKMLKEGTFVEKYLAALANGVWPFESMEQIRRRVEGERKKMEEELDLDYIQ